MKKNYTLSLSCVCAVVLLAAGCTKAEPQIPAVIGANIQSTESVIVDNKDVNVSFKITLSQKVNKDVIIRVVPKGDIEAIDLGVRDFIFLAAQGEGTEYVSPETVKEGNVTFKASAFPDAKSVATVELVLESDDITISEDSKVTIVASKKQPAPPAPITASVSASETEVSIDNGDKNVEFTITLSEPITNDAVFNIKATSDSEVKDGFLLNNPTLTIDAGQTTAVGSILIKANVFTCEHIILEINVSVSTEAEVVMETPSVTIKATKLIK